MILTIQSLGARYSRREDIAERDKRIARLAAEHDTNSQISVMEGVSVSVVSDAKKRVLASYRLNELRELFMSELEATLFNAWQIVHDPPPRISNTGEIVTDDDGNPIPDITAVETALDLVLEAVSQRRALTRADAPKKSIIARVDLRQQGELQWRELFGDQRAVADDAYVAEVVGDE